MNKVKSNLNLPDSNQHSSKNIGKIKKEIANRFQAIKNDLSSASQSIEECRSLSFKGKKRLQKKEEISPIRLLERENHNLNIETVLNQRFDNYQIKIKKQKCQRNNKNMKSSQKIQLLCQETNQLKNKNQSKTKTKLDNTPFTYPCNQKPKKLIPEQDQKKKCILHQLQAKFYCCQCKSSDICLKCLSKGMHTGHQINQTQKSYEHILNNYYQVEEIIKERHDFLKMKENVLVQQFLQVDNYYELKQKQVRNYIESMISFLNDYKGQMLRRIVQEKKKMLTEIQPQFDKFSIQLNEVKKMFANISKLRQYDNGTIIKQFIKDQKMFIKEIFNQQRKNFKHLFKLIQAMKNNEVVQSTTIQLSILKKAIENSQIYSKKQMSNSAMQTQYQQLKNQQTNTNDQLKKQTIFTAQNIQKQSHSLKYKYEELEQGKKDENQIQRNQTNNMYNRFSLPEKDRNKFKKKNQITLRLQQFSPTYKSQIGKSPSIDSRSRTSDTWNRYMQKLNQQKNKYMKLKNK